MNWLGDVWCAERRALWLGVTIMVCGMALGPASGQAQSSLSADQRTIEACLTDARAVGSNPHECISVVSGPCMEQPGGDTTFGMRTCTGRSLEAWDGLLNRDYQTLMGRWQEAGAEGMRTQLRAVQRAWIDYRDKLCDLHAAQFEGGTLAPVIRGGCLEDETARRVIDIQSLLHSL